MYIQLHPTESIRGVKFSFDSHAFYRAKPIPIMITLGYDPSNYLIPEYLYIEMKSEDDMDYASPEELDGCMYNALMDPDLGAPLLLRYIQIFIKYKIFIPIEMYQILQDIEYCDRDVQIGHWSMGERYELQSMSIQANEIYGDTPEEYYINFENLVKGLDYHHPLIEKISGYGTNPPPAEEDYDIGDDEIEEDIVDDGREYKADYVDTSFHPPSYQTQKNRLTLGEGDFSFAEAFCRKHPELTSKIITTEYRNKESLEQEYDVYKLVIMRNPTEVPIKTMANHTVVLLGEGGQYNAHLVLNGAFIKPEKKAPPYVFAITLDDLESSILIPNATTKIVPRTLENTDIIDRIFNNVLAAFGQPAYVKSFSSHALYLRNTNVTMLYDIDAQKIHTHFRGYKFKAIHFNCPHMPGDSKERALPKMLYNFFRSAASLQAIGDKIYMALPYPSDIKERGYRTSYIYRVYDAAAKSGYKVIKKRKFDAQRYPGYVHRMTKKARSAKVAEQIREHVFRRIEPLAELPQSIHYKSPADRKINHEGTPHQEAGRILPELPTDDESSVYDSDEQEGLSGSANHQFVGKMCSTFFSDKRIQVLIKKYNLLDDTPLSLEKGLRASACNGQKADLEFFLSLNVNVNAVDSNPKSQRTALIWAARRNRTECYNLLIEYEADTTLRDADGFCAADYIEQNKSLLTNP